MAKEKSFEEQLKEETGKNPDYEEGSWVVDYAEWLEDKIILEKQKKENLIGHMEKLLDTAGEMGMGSKMIEHFTDRIEENK